MLSKFFISSGYNNINNIIINIECSALHHFNANFFSTCYGDHKQSKLGTLSSITGYCLSPSLS